jgi:peptidoglycan/LPS O-acetylase OafA/YrhL
MKWIGNLSLTEGWRFHVVSNGGGSLWFLAAWTPGYEEQFYAGTGLLIATCGRRWFRVAARLMRKGAL